MRLEAASAAPMTLGVQIRSAEVGLPPREDRIEVAFAGDGSDTLQMRHQGTGQVFATADALSEFLLVPVLTGRPR